MTDLSPGLKLSQNYFITLEKRFFNQLPKIEVRSIFKFAVRFSENDIILQRPLNFGIFPNVIRFFLSPGTLIISFKVPLKAKLANLGGGGAEAGGFGGCYWGKKKKEAKKDSPHPSSCSIFFFDSPMIFGLKSTFFEQQTFNFFQFFPNCKHL